MKTTHEAEAIEKADKLMREAYRKVADQICGHKYVPRKTMGDTSEAVTDAGNAPRRLQWANEAIACGSWTHHNTTIVDLPTHYAVAQYLTPQNTIETVRLNREGVVIARA
jgi:hypothetical protein